LRRLLLDKEEEPYGPLHCVSNMQGC